MWTRTKRCWCGIAISCFLLSYLAYVQQTLLRSVKLKSPEEGTHETKSEVEKIPKRVYGAAKRQVTPRPEDCLDGPKKNVVFVKTHKTGGTTLQNVLVRRAYKYDLFVGLPKYDIVFRYISGMGFKREFMMPPLPGQKVNMLLHHMVFNDAEVSSVMPADTFYLTIIRDPATQFESVFHFFQKLVKSFSRIPTRTPFEHFVGDPRRYFKGRGDGKMWWFGRNNMFFDLGFDNLMESDSYIQRSIEKTEKIFDFVAISEYFDISLLLLREQLCWDMDDVVYLSMNTRNHSTVKPINPDLADKIYQWNKADTMLYKHFNATFWRRVEEYGEIRIKRELAELQKRREKLEHSCVEKEIISNIKITEKMLKYNSPQGVEVTQYKLKETAKNNRTCLGFIIPEREWYAEFLCHQYPYQCPKKIH